MPANHEESWEERGERNGEDNSRTITDSILLARTREYSTDITTMGYLYDERMLPTASC